MTENITDDTLDPTTQPEMEEAADSLVQEAEPVVSTGSPSRASWLWRSRIARIVVILLVITVLAVVVSSVIYSSSRAQRGQILPVDIYPAAKLLGKHATPNSDAQTYATTDTFEAVYQFYAKRITSADGSGCQKVYVGEVQSEDPGQVLGKCFVLNAFQDANQLLSLSIETQLTPDGKPDRTVIVIERSWKG